ncbi:MULTISPECIES: hypothetical protein [Streptomyces]|uniref:hypothetical protein n=1 Tax=Streptomyces TaxID=1883 RepID=UPI00287FE8A7|nr:hypothetical protein [Streptomyces sp. CGMCC 4.1456]WNF63034.1 hypothetical protein RJD14_10735 [Streptomyces sp. CGMCC 4.1456]
MEKTPRVIVEPPDSRGLRAVSVGGTAVGSAWSPSGLRKVLRRFGLFMDQEAPEDFRAFALRNTERDVKTLTRAQGQRSPQNYHEWTVRAMSSSGTSQQILRDQALPPNQRAELKSKQRAELKKNVEQLSKSVLKSYDRSASQDDRDKAKGAGKDLLKELEETNDDHSDKPLLEIRNKPLNAAVSPGEFQSFTIKITNHGDDPVTGVTVEDKVGSASGGGEGGVIHPVLHAQLMTASGDENDCDITAGNTVVSCPTKGDTKIVPEETVTIAIRAVVKASRVPYGEKENITQVKHEEGAQQGSADFAVVKSPKLSEQDLEDELQAIRQCAAHFDSSGVSRQALAVFTEVMGDELERGTPPAQASTEGYKAALTRAEPDEAVSLAAVRVFDVSLRDAAKAFKSAGDCRGFVDKAVSPK